VAKGIKEFFAREKTREVLDQLLKEITLKPPEMPTDSPLVGKTFVFTGGLDRLSREEAKAQVAARGGRVSSSVSAKTDYVVVGSDPGSKYNKARQLGVNILDEEAFEELLQKV
jgi:DNA ligase (NAD+)